MPVSDMDSVSGFTFHCSTCRVAGLSRRASRNSGACRRRLRYGAPSGVLGRDGVSAEALAKEEALAKSGPTRPATHRTEKREPPIPLIPPPLQRYRYASFPGPHLPEREKNAGSQV